MRQKMLLLGAILLTIVIAFASLFQFKLMGVDVEY